MEENRKKRRADAVQLLLTALAAAGIFFLLFLLRDLWPVGGGSILMTDLYSQYAPLLYRFYDVASGARGLFMDFSVSGGANLYVETMGDLLNPFNYLLFLFGRERIYLAVNLLPAVCATAAALTSCLSLQRLWPRNRRYNIALSLSYALSGYMAYQLQIIRWLYLPVLFPLYFLSLLRALKKNRWVCQGLLLAYQLALSLQLGIMTLLFTLFSAAFWMWREKGESRPVSLLFGRAGAEGEERRAIIRRACVSLAAGTLMGILLAAPVWLPQIRFLLHSLRGGESLSFLSVMKRHGLDDLFERLFQIFQPVPCAMTAVCLWRMRKQGGKGRLFWPREGKLLLVWSLFLWLTVVAQPSNLLWHLGSYMCFPVRYAYMVIWSELLLAKWLSVHVEAKGRLAGEQRVKFIPLLLSLFSGGVALWATVSCADRLSQAFSTLAISMTCPKEAVLAAGILLLLFVCVLMAALAEKGKGVLLVFAAGFGGLCVFLFLLLPADNMARTLNQAAYAEMTEVYRADREAGSLGAQACFLRREDDPDLPLNAPLVMGGYSMSGYFPSGSEERYAGGMEALGYLTPWVSVRSWGGTGISDALLGIERQDMPVFAGGLSLKGKPEEIGASFALAGADGPLAAQAWLGEALTGEKIIRRLRPQELFREEEGDCPLRLEEESLVYLDAGIPASELSIWIDGEEIFLPEHHLADGPRRLLFLGSLPAGERSVSIRDRNGNPFILERMELGILSRGLWEKAAECIRVGEKTDRVRMEKTVEVDERRGEIRLRPQEAVGDRTLFLPMAAAAGWSVELDGRRQRTEILFGGFLGAYVPEGTREIVFRFTPPGLYMGLLLACMGLVFLVRGSIASGFPVRLVFLSAVLTRLYAVILWTALLGIYVIPNVGLLICMCRKVIRRLLHMG